MVRKKGQWYDTWHIYPNGPADGATSSTGVDSEVCVNEASPVSASEPGAMQGYRVDYGYESTTRMGEKPVTPPPTAAVINGNGISSHSSEGDSTNSDTARLSNCSSDPVEQMTNTCDPAGPKKRWRNKYRFKKRNKVLGNPAVLVAPQLPPREKEDWSNDIQEVPKTVRESQSYAGVINGDGISSHSSNSEVALPDGSDLVKPYRRAGDRRRHNKFKWKKRTKKDPETEYPAWNFPVAPRLEPHEEEDWSDEIEEVTRKLYESLPYDPEDILKSELQDLRLYPNTSPIPRLVDNYIPSSHHKRPVRWTCSSLPAELGQFDDAYE